MIWSVNKVLLFAFVGALLGNADPKPCTNVDWVLSDLRNVANSPNYYWAWTYEWLNHGGVKGDMWHVVERDGVFMPKPISEVELVCDIQKRAGGRTAVLNDDSICGTSRKDCGDFRIGWQESA